MEPALQPTGVAMGHSPAPRRIGMSKVTLYLAIRQNVTPEYWRQTVRAEAVRHLSLPAGPSLGAGE
jgi:hypothetical protein